MARQLDHSSNQFQKPDFA